MECSICLENINLNSDSAVMDCMHHFHYSCINSWMRYKTSTNTCPTCNTGINIIKTSKYIEVKEQEKEDQDKETCCHCTIQ